MKYFTSFLLTMMVTLGYGATLEGPITLKYDESMFSKDVFKKEFGDVVKVACNWRAGEFFGKETVFAGITAKNTGTKTMYYQYYVAFYNKDKKLIGATGQGSFGDDGLAPGKDEQLGSCLIHLPKDKYKEIASFQAIVYESDVPPPKK